MRTFSFSLVLAASLVLSAPVTAVANDSLSLVPGAVPYRQVAEELLDLRTSHSQTFLNVDRTRTVIQASQPLHYQDDNGDWVSLDYRLVRQGPHWVFPAQRPDIKVDQANGHLQWRVNQAGIYLGDLRWLSPGRSTSLLGLPQPEGADTLVHEAVDDGLVVERQFFASAVMTTVQIPAAMEGPWGERVIEQAIRLPSGYSLAADRSTNIDGQTIMVLDEQGRVALRFQPPVVAAPAPVAAKTRHLASARWASLDYVQTSESEYIIRLSLPDDEPDTSGQASALVLRSLVTIEDTQTVHSCYFPNYQAASLTVDVPEGETVLSTDFEYDFVAIGEGWRADQRSFLTGPSGQTAVFAGSGNNPGTQTYSIELSEIGNGLSDGQVTYTFHAARTWGGSGCNASFNFINRRVVSVTYGTVSFGDGPVVINEFSASNRQFEDSFNRTEDWIELHNVDPDNFVDLSGFHLSNDAQNPTLWQISDGVIPPGGYLVVFASKRDISSGMVQHANFNLTQLRPDQVVLADPDGHVLESHDMPITQVNHSVGRVSTDADEWGIFVSPTPGQSNAVAYLGYASRPQFSHDAGLYSGSITLTISAAGEDEQIRYTLDGSTPDESSPLYGAPITLTETTVVRARSFSGDSAYLPGFIETRTYLINEAISLPVFSFSGDQDLLNLFGGNDTLRPLGHFEYFEADGQFIDGNFGDFNKHGNDSWNYPQRGVDFISRDDYGYQRRLEHRFFETSDRTRFRRLMVKAAANDNYPFEPGGAHIRDSYIQHLSQIAGLDLDERSSTNVLVFVNGQYWGVYDLRERVDDNNFTDYYYGQDYRYRESDLYLQFLKTWGATQAHFGNQPALADWASLRQYVQNNNMGDPAHFAVVNEQLNIASLIDYFVINSWVVSRDWLNYNTGWWRGLDPGGQARQWRYILWDMEAALGHFVNYTGLPDATHTAPPCQAENLNVGNGHTAILRKLIQENPEVRRQYVTRYIDLLNTHFSSDSAIALLDAMIDDIAPEMPRHISRWGGNLSTWQGNVESIRTFVANRNDYLMASGLASCYNLSGPFDTQINVVPEASGQVRLNSEWLPSFPFQATLFGNIQTRLVAQPALGHAFSHWEIDGVAAPPDLSEAEIELMISQAASVTAHFSPPVTDGELIHYWHFNDLVTPEDVVIIEADFSVIPDLTAAMTYTGTGPRDIDASNSGSDLNLYLDQPPGSSARVRNPSEGRTLVFDVPTLGYQDINFTYAVERTNNGMLRNFISYSIDGNTFTQDGLPSVEFDLGEAGVYYLINLDFSGIDGVDNNPDFRIQIAFDGNTTGDSGNNRFDNISLKGVEIEAGEPSELAFLSVNDNAAVYAQEPFSVVIQAQDDLGVPAAVLVDTEVVVTLVSGTGQLSGNTSGILAAGSQSLILDGLVYSEADANVSLGAVAQGLGAAFSPSFAVLSRSYVLGLASNVEGAGEVSGAGLFEAGETVAIEAAAKPGFVFQGWFDNQGELISQQAQWSFDMPPANLAYTANFGLPDNGALIHYWHFNALDDGELESVPADFTLTGDALITYPGQDPDTPAGVMDRRGHNASNPVSNFNLRLDQSADDGNVLRVRNPSQDNLLRIDAPSTGFRDIVVSFATTRTNNGAEQQAFLFSSDGGNSWTSLGEPYAITALDDDGYLARTFRLHAFDQANDNPDLVFKIRFLGDGADNASGNNRFDNITIEGVSLQDLGDPIFWDRFD
ncbi:MAG: CotH kinase family protein [Wenzhouxiangella sp.]